MYSVCSVGNSSQLPVAIVGGGITGLAAAHRLAVQGRPFRLFEASARLGGNILTERTDEWLYEAGPNSLQLTPAVAALLGELKLTPLHARPAAKNRYLVRDGRPVAAPSSPPAFLKSPLFSASAKLRLLTEFLSRPRRRTADLSLADFTRAHFGDELVNYALRPFVSGVFAGDADQLSARLAFPALWEAERAHGSLLRAQLASAKARRSRGEPAGPPPIVSFPNGLSELPGALAARLPAGSISLNTRVTALTPPAAPGQPWQLHSTQSSASASGSASDSSRSALSSGLFSAVLLALPASALARLAIGPVDRPLAALADITCPPVSALFLGYRHDQVAHPLDGFGMLVPPAERRSILGVLFNSTLFPDRAPDGHHALTVMTGGALQPDLARLDHAELLPRVRADLAALLGIRGEPVFIRRHVWPHAIPQYNLGYERFLETIAAVEAAHPGLFIGGHIRDGISLPNCLAAGEKLAARTLPPL